MGIQEVSENLEYRGRAQSDLCQLEGNLGPVQICGEKLSPNGYRRVVPQVRAGGKKRRSGGEEPA